MYILGRAKVDAVDNQPRARDEVLKELKTSSWLKDDETNV
jgi:hypothetical protein